MEDGPAMSDRERRLAQVEAAAEGARYREALQGRGAPAEAVRKMAEAGEVGDVRDVEDPGFAEPYEAAVKFQEEEYGGSLTRKGLVDEIAGYEYVDEDGRKQRARGEDDKLYSEEYSKAKEKNPDATEEELQDAALKAVMAKRAERAVLEMPKSFDVEATEDVGAGLQYEKTLDELRKEKEAAEADKKEDDVVSKAVSRVQGKAPAQPVVTPQEAAERITPLLERYKGAAVPFDDFIQQITSVEEEPSIEEPAEPAEDAVKEEAPVATAPIESDEELTERIERAETREVSKKAFEEGFSNVYMPGLRVPSSNLYRKFDELYQDIYPSQEEIERFTGARGRLMRTHRS